MNTVERLSAALTARYRIERELGRGGMATVYLARDLRHERDVAIKVLNPELSLAEDRFLREIAITARLNHPHILALLDSGSADDGAILYYVMPFATGQSLRDRLEGASVGRCLPQSRGFARRFSTWPASARQPRARRRTR